MVEVDGAYRYSKYENMCPMLKFLSRQDGWTIMTHYIDPYDAYMEEKTPEHSLDLYKPTHITAKTNTGLCLDNLCGF